MKSNKTVLPRLSILVLVFLLLCFGGWIWWTDGTAPVDPTNKTPVIFTVKSGEGVRTIAGELAEQNLIRSPTSFFILVKLLRMETKLQAGDYRLNQAMDAKTVVQELTHGVMDVWVTILEGWRIEEVASKLTKELDIPEQEFLKYAREGYMFPDTYLIPRSATPAGVAQLFLDTFNKKVTPTMRSDAKKIGLSFDGVIVLASIVEREGRTSEDRPVIAGILLKRLKSDWPLQADATLQYALGYQPFDKTWWKKSITNDDKEIQSPYNTYKNTGLPTRPISNPGLGSIRGVLAAQNSDYWYYLHDLSGRVHYAKTLDEHNANVARYLQ